MYVATITKDSLNLVRREMIMVTAFFHVPFEQGQKKPFATWK